MNDIYPDSAASLIAFAVEAARKHCELHHTWCDGTELARRVRERYPAYEFGQLGFEKLGQVVNAAEEAGKLVRRSGIQHMEVAPPDLLSTLVEKQPKSKLQGAERVEKVHPEVWQGLMRFDMGCHRFLNRNTYQVEKVYGSDESKQVLDAEANPALYPIKRIPADQQRQWIREFLAKEGVDPDENVIESAQWYKDFPAWLQNRDRDLHFRWRQHRVYQAIAYAKNWAEHRNLPVSAVVTSTSRATPSTVTPALSQSNKGIPYLSAHHHPSVADSLSDSALRNALLAAVQDLRTEELLELPLPPKLVLRHLRSGNIG